MRPITKDSETILKILLVCTTIVLIISIVLLASVPPVSRDALTHHLIVPKLYLQNGKMVELPDIPFSYYPMNLDLLYIVPLYFGNDIVPKFIHFLFALMTAGLLFGFLKKRLGTLYALIGSLMFLSTPIIVKLSITVYVDLGLVFFSTAALIYLVKWKEDDFLVSYLIFSAAFCGLALGTKYNGLVTFFLLTLFVPFIYLRSRPERQRLQGKAAGYAAMYALIALLFFSPWMIRNVYWTGNPIFPLYNKIFSTQSVTEQTPISEDLQQEVKERTGGWNHLAIRRIIFKESWAEIAAIPIRIFFQGRDDEPKYFDGKLNPFLLFLPIFAFFPRREETWQKRNEKNLLLAFVILFLLISFFRTCIRIRYIVPVLPALIILSTIGLHQLVGFLKTGFSPVLRRFGAASLSAAMVLLFGMNAVYLINQFRVVDPIGYLSGKVGREMYISRYRPEYPLMKFANEHLAGGAKILGLYLGNRRYYSDREIEFGENFLYRTIILSATADGIRKALVDRGFTHVMVNLDLLRRLVLTLNSQEQAVFVEFYNQDLIVLDKNLPYVLYELKRPHIISIK